MPFSEHIGGYERASLGRSGPRLPFAAAMTSPERHSPARVLAMTRRWISDVPSKMV
jgi:hypothetical protein